MNGPRFIAPVLAIRPGNGIDRIPTGFRLPVLFRYRPEEMYDVEVSCDAGCAGLPVVGGTA
ncbi:MAG: hypothetical protein PHP59_03775 [Methanofollis sp.]|nr:hypothetical protein [Methanofollis sp.]